MSGKFNSMSMLNKTPPVCQKHKPGDPIPPGFVWPTITACITVYGPFIDPSATWQKCFKLAFAGAGPVYEGNVPFEPLDPWTATCGFNSDYSKWTAAMRIGTFGGDVLAFMPTPIPTIMQLPVDTGLGVAETVIRADNVEWRFTV